MFGAMLRQVRCERGLSLRALASRIPCDPGLLSKLENGRRSLTEKFVAAVDQLLDARGELIGAARLEKAAAADTDPWATAELIARVQASDSSSSTLESVQSTVEDLCCRYSTTPALDLRREAHVWLKHLARMLHKPIGITEHRELLVAAGWLALLVGCLEYDAGMRASAEATRAAVAARNGELEEAVRTDLQAFTSDRRSLPSLTMVAGELEAELTARFPHETATRDFREAVRTLKP